MSKWKFETLNTFFFKNSAWGKAMVAASLSDKGLMKSVKEFSKKEKLKKAKKKKNVKRKRSKSNL